MAPTRVWMEPSTICVASATACWPSSDRLSDSPGCSGHQHRQDDPDANAPEAVDQQGPTPARGQPHVVDRTSLDGGHNKKPDKSCDDPQNQTTHPEWRRESRHQQPKGRAIQAAPETKVDDLRDA